MRGDLYSGKLHRGFFRLLHSFVIVVVYKLIIGVANNFSNISFSSLPKSVCTALISRVCAGCPWEGDGGLVVRGCYFGDEDGVGCGEAVAFVGNWVVCPGYGCGAAAGCFAFFRWDDYVIIVVVVWFMRMCIVCHFWCCCRWRSRHSLSIDRNCLLCLIDRYVLC